MGSEGSLRTLKTPSRVPILSQIIPLLDLPPFFKINFNVIFPSTPRTSKWPLSFRFPYQINASILCIPHTRPIPLSSHPQCYVIARFEGRNDPEIYKLTPDGVTNVRLVSDCESHPQTATTRAHRCNTCARVYINGELNMTQPLLQVFNIASLCQFAS